MDEPASPRRGRVTDVGGWEPLDRRPHPLAAVLTMAALVGVFVVALVGLGVAVEQGDRRVDVPDVLVPSVEGTGEDAARETLEEVGLLMEVSEAPNELVPRGTVFEQDPIPGARIEQGSAVSVGVSTGPAGPVVPDVVGQQISEATGVLVAAGLTVEVSEVADEDVRVGEVLGTEPVAGRQAGADRVVAVQVSSGPAPRTVPEVADRDVIEVVEELGRLELRPESIRRVVDETLADGTVLSIEPAPGTEVPRYGEVELVVVGTPEPVVMPAVEGLLRSTATEVLADTPLDVTFRVVALPAGDPRDGRVLRQGVAAMSEVPRGTPVELVVGSAPQLPAPTTTVPRGSEGSTTASTSTTIAN